MFYYTFMYTSAIFQNSLRAIYESLRLELHRLEEVSKNSLVDRAISSIYHELVYFLTARVDLIDLYPFHIIHSGDIQNF